MGRTALPFASTQPRKFNTRTTSDCVALSARLAPVTVLPRKTHRGFVRLNAAHCAPLSSPDPELLVESQQAAQQVPMAAGVLHPTRQVGYGIVLAISVLVKPAVGVVEQQAFAVGVQQRRILADYLVEGGRILKGKATAGTVPVAALAKPCRMRPNAPRRPAPDCCRRSPARPRA